MMKIIRVGSKEKQVVNIFTIECPDCHARFECSEDDFLSYSENVKNFFARVKCPCCEKEFNVAKDNYLITTEIRTEFVEEVNNETNN